MNNKIDSSTAETKNNPDTGMNQSPKTPNDWVKYINALAQIINFQPNKKLAKTSN